MLFKLLEIASFKNITCMLDFFPPLLLTVQIRLEVWGGGGGGGKNPREQCLSISIHYWRCSYKYIKAERKS